MARIPDSEIERLKKEVSVENLVTLAGITLQKSGKDRIGTCPFHVDGEPSLVVTPAKNLWHCFGCQIGGGPIDWVMQHDKVSFRRAVELLASDSSLAAQPLSDVPVARPSGDVAQPAGLSDADQAALDDTIAYYHRTLQQSPEAQAYLKARGLDHPDLIEYFQLGYANRTLSEYLAGNTNGTEASARASLHKVGIFRETGHEHFNGSLVVPILDAAGHVTEVYGRKIRNDLRKGTPTHLYLPGPHRGVWNESALSTSKEIILCESLIDAMTFWCAGLTNVTTVYGVEGLTEDHLTAFQRYGIERILIAYDRDDAGDRSAKKLATQLMSKGIDCLRVLFPKGMDANAYALQVTPADQSLRLLVRQAEWMGNGPRPDATLGEVKAMLEMPVALSQAVPAALADPVVSPVVAPAAVASPLPFGSDELHITVEDRHWRIRGHQKNLRPEQMRVNVQVRRGVAEVSSTDRYHVDTIDLYAARSRTAYIKQAAEELDLSDSIIKSDMAQVLVKLEALQADAIAQSAPAKNKAPTLSTDEESAALELLQAPNLIERIVTDMECCGVVGEANNLLAGYLAAVSRKLDTPLAILIQSSSAAGKSSLMEAVLAMMPEEERVQYSAMTGQSLFYLGETDMQHKILAIAEEEGVRQAAYALKLLQSDGELTMASTGKDDATGTLVTKQYRVKGPIMLMLTTTAIDVDEELMNRCLVLSVNESREQTQAIHTRQRMKQTLAGLLAASDKDAFISLHRNAQRLLKSVVVVNPYADQLTFLDDKTRMRRDHMKYLTLIRAIALLHQYQRPLKTIEHRGQTLSYIEVIKEDIALANRIAHDVLGRTLDELPPQTRRLLTLLQGWVADRIQVLCLAAKEFRFTRRTVRDATHWGDTQLKLHLSRLVDLEYLVVHRQAGAFEYELLYDGTADGRHLCGLIDVTALDTKYDGNRSGLNVIRSGSGRPMVGLQSGDGRQGVSGLESVLPGGLAGNEVHQNGSEPQKAYMNGRNTPVSVAIVLREG
jgi:DNA primase catalytic core